MQINYQKSIMEIYEAMLKYYSGDPMRIQHFTKVHAYARIIAVEENLSEKDLYIIEVTALVHDIGIKKAEEKYHSSMGKYQELEGPAEVLKLLDNFKLCADIKDRIAYIVGHHHSYDCIDGIDFQILVEADFLVNIYEDKIQDKAVYSVREKIFKTSSGIRLLNTMYNLQSNNPYNA